jgi:hypothetical protein
MTKAGESEWLATPVWEWRQLETTADAAQRRGREAAAARLQGVLGGVVGLAVAAALRYFHRPTMAIVVATIALLTALLALAAPLTLYRQLSEGLARLGHWVSTAVTWVLMTLLFFLLFLPVGLVMRATGKLTFTRFAEPRKTTYWTSIAARAAGVDAYRKQF